MGMFDYVNFDMNCPKCGNVIGDFQSKDGPRELYKIEPDSVDDFYSSCYVCKTWIEFTRPPRSVPTRKEPLTREQIEALGFSLTVREYKK